MWPCFKSPKIRGGFITPMYNQRDYINILLSMNGKALVLNLAAALLSVALLGCAVINNI